MGLSRQGCCHGLQFPSPGDLPDPGIKHASPALQVILYCLSHLGSQAFRNVFLFLSATYNYFPPWFLIQCIYFSNVKLACQDTLWQVELMIWWYGDQLTLIRAHLFSLLGTEVRLHADLSNGSSRIQLCQSSHCLLDANSNCNFPEVGIHLLIMCWKVGTFLGVDVCECVCESDRERACFLVAVKQNLWVGADSFCSCLASHIKQKPMSLISWGLSSKELCVCVCVCTCTHTLGRRDSGTWGEHMRIRVGKFISTVLFPFRMWGVHGRQTTSAKKSSFEFSQRCQSLKGATHCSVKWMMPLWAMAKVPSR